MEKMEVTKDSIPRVLFQKRWLKEKTRKRVLTFLTIFVLYIACWMLVSFYQQSRYDVEKFNCVNFTREAMGYLKSFGIKSFPMVGTLKDNKYKAHSWVGIDFFGYTLNYEPQALFFFLPEWRYTDVKVDKFFEYY